MKIYLASPYSDPKESVRIHRWSMACEAAGRLLNLGYLVYSPIAHTHPIATHCDLPQGWDFWKRLDESFITEWADCLVVLKMDGWKESLGVRAEIELATLHELPVLYWLLGSDFPPGLDELSRQHFEQLTGRSL